MSTGALNEDRGQNALDKKYEDLKGQFGEEFFEYDEAKATQTLYHPDLNPDNPEPQDLRAYFLDRINQVRRGEITNAIFPVDIIRRLTREEIASMETEGIVFSGINDEHPDGGIYVKNEAQSSLGDRPERIRHGTLQAILVTGVLKGVTGLITRPPIDKVPDDISGLKRFPMNSLVAATYKDKKWTQSHVHPDGEWIRGGFDDTSSQYGQGCFEGMVASGDGGEVPLVRDGIEVDFDNGKITLFRPEENAKRFIKSCKRLGMPPVSVNQFMQAVIAAVKNNKKLIPKDGKLYVRPFMVGLRGGTGIKPAEQYIFGVEVSPFGNYISADSEGIDLEKELPGSKIKAIVYERPDYGREKVSGNYATLIEEKEKAKEEGYNDLLLLTRDGKIQECASNNFFLVSRDKSRENLFHFHTTSLEANILPGITRKSLLTLLRDPAIQAKLGANIEVHDDKIVNEYLVHSSHGAFGTGTAAGISNFRTVRTLQGKEVSYDDHETQQLIKKVYDLLQDLRRGKVPGYENWVMEV